MYDLDWDEGYTPAGGVRPRDPCPPEMHACQRSIPTRDVCQRCMPARCCPSPTPEEEQLEPFHKLLEGSVGANEITNSEV